MRLAATRFLLLAASAHVKPPHDVSPALPEPGRCCGQPFPPRSISGAGKLARPAPPQQSVLDPGPGSDELHGANNGHADAAGRSRPAGLEP